MKVGEFLAQSRMTVTLLVVGRDEVGSSDDADVVAAEVIDRAIGLRGRKEERKRQ
jgi:hypothetical protein